jgi:hypothetical protein
VTLHAYGWTVLWERETDVRTVSAEHPRLPGALGGEACVTWDIHGRRKFFHVVLLSKAPSALEAVKRIDVLLRRNPRGFVF